MTVRSKLAVHINLANRTLLCISFACNKKTEKVYALTLANSVQFLDGEELWTSHGIRRDEKR